MENLVKKLTSQQVAIIVLVALVLSLGSIFYFKMRLGPDFNASQVVELQLDHEATVNDITATANTIQFPARIDKESTGKFYVYFQNVPTDNISSFIKEFKTKQSGVLTAQVFNFKPWGELYLKERVSIVAALSLLGYLIYCAFVMRKSGIDRLELIQLLVNDLLSLAFITIVMLGVGSLLGALGQTMSVSYWDLFLLGIAMCVIVKVYRISRMRDILENKKHEALADTYVTMVKKYWPEFVFVIAFMLLGSTLPWLVLQGRLVWATILPGVAVILAFFSFFFLDYNMLKILSEWNMLDNKSLTRFKLNKKW